MSLLKANGETITTAYIRVNVGKNQRKFYNVAGVIGHKSILLILCQFEGLGKHMYWRKSSLVFWKIHNSRNSSKTVINFIHVA